MKREEGVKVDSHIFCLCDQVVDAVETEKCRIFGDRINLVLNTDFEVSVRCPRKMSRINLSMKR